MRLVAGLCGFRDLRVVLLNAVVVDCCLDLCLLRFGYSCLLVAGFGLCGWNAGCG